METYYWIAINGSSCAGSALPLPVTVEVIPTPQLLVGFKTRDEQRRAQQFLLKESIPKVRQYMNSLPGRADKGEIKVIKPDRPQPPTRGETSWLVAPNDKAPDGIVDGGTRSGA